MFDDVFKLIKCPLCRMDTPEPNGRLSLDENLKNDHDFMALLINIQQSSAAQPVAQPSTSR
jgi:hypothetical protein